MPGAASRIIGKMILPEDTPGLAEGIARNKAAMEKGEWPEPLNIPSTLELGDEPPKPDEQAGK